ncbi:MAG TPA: aspartate aminotransferase family protein [Anaerolineae bacterium]|nr:aspartate aminotransferase family protein [Anaerolineae bacterium]
MQILDITSSIQSLESAHTSGVYPKRDLVIVEGEGASLWDEQGRRYIDCVGGQGAANLGHSHPAIVEAISQQARRLISCPEIFYNDVRAAYLAELTAATPGELNRAFLSNSGAEAIEAAIKFARVSTGRREIVAAMRGFHGRTMGALSATWNKKYRGPFMPLVPDFTHIPYNNIAALEAAVSDATAAVLLEPVQGEGGVRPADPAFLHAARELCDAHGALLIVDEIQTGFGRTGRLFASEHYDLQPDILALAKSIAGGLPMGATLLGPRVGELPRLVHGSTFGGNPLVAAAARATLRVLQEERLPERAARLGALAQERLARIDSPLIREVRGLGLMLGIELKIKVGPVLRALQERGVLALPAGATVLRLLPPLVIDEADLFYVIDTIEAILQEMV